jgi:hypothetical protein
MGSERWAKRRDMAVESRWLRELRARDQKMQKPMDLTRPPERKSRMRTFTGEPFKPVGVE